ncbi:MAG: D-tyrosyl-tRNA(Tyr) deacylase [Candidatus Cloacimonadota bacterium]|nr:MAG: D-tyrosyl-tRNA(Tyr) deacylase [Candidatus Cloacimonadota bacterium]
MRIVIQRVSKASVSINGRIIGSIGKGVVILLGISKGDTEKNVDILSLRCIKLRIFEDENEKLNLSMKDIQGEALIISQFTLCADTKKGRRPSFTKAASYSVAKPLYERFVTVFEREGIHTETGDFGSKMLVDIHNDGPVTLILDT